MGQKTHPYAFRIGVVNDWKSKWYSDKEYVQLVNEDWKLRDYLRGELRRGAVSRIDIERTRDRVVVEIHTARPGVVIGRKGAEAERLRGDLEKMASKPVKLNIIEVKDADTDAQLLAQGIADQLENRVAFRRAMKRAVQTAMKAGAGGVRVEAKGRLGGSEMGRREWYREGRVPLHTLRADVDFGMATAHTTVGTIGVKVHVYKGDVIGGTTAATREKIAAEAALATGGPAPRGRAVPAKARAEQAAGGDRVPRLIEAGGGKRLIEAGGGKKEGKRLIEAGGGKRRIDAEEAEAQYREERDVVDTDDAAMPVDEITGSDVTEPDITGSDVTESEITESEITESAETSGDEGPDEAPEAQTDEAPDAAAGASVDEAEVEVPDDSGAPASDVAEAPDAEDSDSADSESADSGDSSDSDDSVGSKSEEEE